MEIATMKDLTDALFVIFVVFVAVSLFAAIVGDE
jgi:hypothetical protein